jgi:hypothetical protein
LIDELPDALLNIDVKAALAVLTGQGPLRDAPERHPPSL